MSDTTIATFPDHTGADAAVKRLAAAGFDIRSLSILGRGYHTEEKVTGFYGTGDRVRFWGKHGAFWGIRDKIMAALHRSWFDPAKIAVTTQSGKVKLTGKVNTWYERDAASSAAWAAPATTSVENDISEK